MTASSKPKSKPVREVILNWLKHESYGSTPMEVMVSNLLYDLWQNGLVIIDPQDMTKWECGIEDYYPTEEPQPDAD